MKSYYFPTANLTARIVDPDPNLVGPTPQALTRIWNVISSPSSWPLWVMAVDRLVDEYSGIMARGSSYQISGPLGAGKLEILRWDPLRELVFMLKFEDLRVVIAIELNQSDTGTAIKIEGEFQWGGWKNSWGSFFKVFLSRRQRLMLRRLEQVINNGPANR